MAILAQGFHQIRHGTDRSTSLIAGDVPIDAHEDLFEALDIVGGLFLLLILAETIWDRMVGSRPSLKESIANFVVSAVSVLLERTAFGFAFVLGLYLVSPFALVELPMTWWTWVLALIVVDFSYYWMHRWEHEIRVLWAHHVVHHSSPEFNLTTSLRLSWVEGAIEWIFFVPMILLGFDIVQVIGALTINLLYQTWIHTQRIGSLGWLDRVFNTPSVHRVHHGSDPKYLDKNYGGILMIWDRMFGTYQPEEEPVTFGITKPINTSNPVAINFLEYVYIAKDLFACRSLRSAATVLFGRPGALPQER